MRSAVELRSEGERLEEEERKHLETSCGTVC